jgi:hypothetical protein
MASSSQCFSGASLAGFYEWESNYSTMMALSSLSTALYGLNIALAINCLKHIWNRKKSFASKGRLWGSCLYICMMIAFASEAVIQLHINIISNINLTLLRFLKLETCVNNDALPLLPDLNFYFPRIALPLSIWGADGLLVRNFMLCNQSDNNVV